MRLAPNQLKADFDTHGFIRYPSLFSQSEVEGIRGQIINYRKNVVPQLKEEKRIFLNGDPAQVIHLGNMDRFSTDFEKLIREPRLLDLAQSLLGCTITPWSMHFRNSPPGSPHETFAHQDADGPNLDPSLGVSFWVALGDYTAVDGCLRYVDRSHRDRYQPHMAGPLPNPYYDCSREVVVPAKAGDVLAHHWFTVHRTAPNQGNQDRWALMISYVVADYQRMDPKQWLLKYENAPL